jgi:ribokinase
MIVVTSGANATLTPQHVAATALEGQRVLLCQLETPAPAIEALFRAGVAKGALRILNAAPALPQGAALFPLTDILILNQTELATYARLDHEPVAAGRGVAHLPQADEPPGPDGDRHPRLGRRRHRAPRRGLPGRGPQGQGGRHHRGRRLLLRRPGRLPVAGMDLREAVEHANAAAALSVQKSGAAPSMPSRREVEQFLEG